MKQELDIDENLQELKNEPGVHMLHKIWTKLLNKTQIAKYLKYEQGYFTKRYKDTKIGIILATSHRETWRNREMEGYRLRSLRMLKNWNWFCKEREGDVT